MKWKVNQTRRSLTGDVAAVGDPSFADLQGQKIAVVLTDNIDFKTKKFATDGEWWQNTAAFADLIVDDAVILVRRCDGVEEDGSAIVGLKIGLFRIANVSKEDGRLSFDLVERLNGAIE